MELYNNDCLEVMKDLSSNSIDLLFCDLPYGQTQCKWDTKIDLDLFWKEVNRICKINCPMFFTTTTKFGVDLINSNPNNFRYDLVWVKTTSSGFLLAKKMPMRKHEMIYVFYRKIPLYDLSSHSHKFLNSMSGMSNAKTNICYGDAPISVRNKQYDPPLPNSLLEIKSQKGKHSTQKPTELMKWILKYYSKEGDIVLDPTMGSGSTGVACKEMNRKFIGIEKDENIFKSAVERLNNN
jgi:site-specific DNA-methyltransferase (adenine-specific)